MNQLAPSANAEDAALTIASLFHCSWPQTSLLELESYRCQIGAPGPLIKGHHFHGGSVCLHQKSVIPLSFCAIVSIPSIATWAASPRLPDWAAWEPVCVRVVAPDEACPVPLNDGYDGSVASVVACGRASIHVLWSEYGIDFTGVSH